MCGIAVIIKDRGKKLPSNILYEMRDIVSHRGPDDKGSIFFNEVGNVTIPNRSSKWSVGLAHRRLSIIDLSEHGHQPMSYREKYWITYNGEVYNYIELRQELIQFGHTFKSESDTEVILASYSQWGTDCFRKFRGMWGMVILDLIKNELVICRDRMGIKPLYICKINGLVAIVSEIKQLLSLPDFSPRLDIETAAEYINTGYQLPNKSFFKDVITFDPGTWQKINTNTLISQTPQSYWDPEKIGTTIDNPNEAGSLFYSKFQESVQFHMRSDVPVGCALSGGLDSSSISVLASPLLSNESQLDTFTVSFPGESIDEMDYSETVLKSINGKSHVITPTPSHFMDDLDKFIYTHDEPVSGMSVYASYALAKITKAAGVPVILNGQGGDEIFSGYWQSYFLYLFSLMKNFDLLQVLKHFSGSALPKGNELMIYQIPNIIKRYYYRSNPSTLITLTDKMKHIKSDFLNTIIKSDFQTQRVDIIRKLFLPKYLKNDDRNTMAFSIEGRYPLLDHELIELCLSFSSNTLYNRGWTKYPLRLGLNGLLPDNVINRKTKFGFEIPWKTWFTGELKPHILKWSTSDRPIWEYVERNSVNNLVQNTLNQKKEEKLPYHTIFRLYMFDKWLEVYKVD